MVNGERHLKSVHAVLLFSKLGASVEDQSVYLGVAKTLFDRFRKTADTFQGAKVKRQDCRSRYLTITTGTDNDLCIELGSQALYRRSADAGGGTRHDNDLLLVAHKTDRGSGSASVRGPWPDTGDALDLVVHDVAWSLRCGELGVRRHVDLCQPIEQVPRRVAGLDGGMGS